MRNAARSTILTLCALALPLVLGVAPASAASSAQYRIEGRGWGHGIGMSQYGANGYAQRGLTAEQIIEHYFTGTTVAARPADGPNDLRVLLQSYLQPARVQMTSAGIVRQGVSTVALLPGDVVEMRSTGAFLVTTRVRAGAKNQVVSGASAADATIVPEVDGGVKILFDADHARAGTSFRGTLTGHRFEGEVSVFNTLPFESYLRGVVPDEMPPSWHPQALGAQAIAARSYALRSLRRDYNWFDVYSDTRSQVYGGVGAEEPSSDAAVAATAGMVARVGGPAGEVAQTFFFSTSGGRTATNQQVWGSAPLSYLSSVPSPYETASSYFVWKGADVQTFTPPQLGARLGYSGTFRAASNTVHPSGYAKDVVIATTQGPRTMTASKLQAKLGLRSTWFRIGYLSIGAPNAVPTGGYARLTGRIPVAGATSLLLTQGGTTRTLPLKPVGAKGTWTIRARITATTKATLTRAGAVGPSITIAAG